MRFYAFITLLFSAVTGNAQIVNGNFEQWYVDSNNVEMPVGWTSDYNAATTIDKVTESASGAYAMRVMSRSQGFEGWLYGFATTKAAAGGTGGIFTCSIAVDSLAHGTEDSCFAIIQIDTSFYYSPWGPSTSDTFGILHIGAVTNGYINVQVPFTLPAGVDSFYVHIAASNDITPLSVEGYVSLRVDSASVSFLNGVPGFKLDQKISLYPVPAQNELTITDAGELRNYCVFDNAGRKVQIGQVNQTRRIDVSQLADGNYFMQLFRQDGSAGGKAFSVMKK